MKLAVAFSEQAFELENSLDLTEQQHMRRFRFEYLQSQYLFAHCFKRRALSYYCLSYLAHEWHFKHSSAGKPFVANILSKDEKLAFNLSHSGTSVVLALVHSNHDMAVGVDIERYRSIDDIDSMIDMVCHPQEQKALEGLTNKEQGFYTLWTAKEALLKAHGSGLINDLNHLNCKQSLLCVPAYSIEWMGKKYNLTTIDLGWGVITVAWLQSLGVSDLVFDDWRTGQPCRIEYFTF
ncbi:MAG: 4'-phosphopantetheinyl transferase family protein [Marinomonas sp.]